MAPRAVPAASVQAVAAPVDRYVNPFMESPEPSKLMGLAQSLATVNPAIQDFLAMNQSDLVNRDTAAGVNSEARADPTAEFEANRDGWLNLINGARAKDAVDGTNNGDMIAASSPHFQRGFMKARINRLGLGLEDHLVAEWKSNPTVEIDGRQVNLKNVNDPEAVRAWAQATSTAYADKYGMMDLDPVIMAEHFTPRTATAEEAIRDHHTKYRLGVIKAAYTNELMASVGAMTAEGTEDGNYAPMAEGLQGLLDSAIRDGMSPKEANKVVVTAINMLATETDDASILDVLDHLSTGNGPLGNINWVREDVAKTFEKIDDNIAEADNRAWTNQQREREELKRSGLTAAGMALANGEDIQAMIDGAIQLGEPAIADAMRAAAKTHEEGVRLDALDPVGMADLRHKAAQHGVDYSHIRVEGLNGVATGRWSLNDYNSLLTFTNQMEGDQAIHTNPVYMRNIAHIDREIRKRFTKEHEYADDGTPLGGTADARAATQQFTEDASDWRATNPDASTTEFYKAQEDILNNILNMSSFQQNTEADARNFNQASADASNEKIGERNDILPTAPTIGQPAAPTANTFVAGVSASSTVLVGTNNYEHFKAGIAEADPMILEMINALAATAGLSARDYMLREQLITLD